MPWVQIDDSIWQIEPMTETYAGRCTSCNQKRVVAQQKLGYVCFGGKPPLSNGVPRFDLLLRLRSHIGDGSVSENDVRQFVSHDGHHNRPGSEFQDFGELYDARVVAASGLVIT